MTPVRVVVVDDHEIVRAGLLSMLAKEPDIHVVGSAATGEDGLRVIADLKPDVAVVDYSLPRMSGVQVCEEVVSQRLETAVVILTGLSHDDVVFNAIEAGARGYVYKDIEGHALKRAIRAVARGEDAFDPKVTARVLHWARRAASHSADTSLSQQEVATLRLVANGATNKDVAGSLHVSENTVKTYLRRAMEKLGCHNRSEAAVVAARKGLL